MKKLIERKEPAVKRDNLEKCELCKGWREIEAPFHEAILYPYGFAKCFCAYHAAHKDEKWAVKRRNMAGWTKKGSLA